MSARKLKTCSTFAEWYKDQPDKQRRLISRLRKFVNATSPKLVESSKWTNGVWLKGEVPVIYIHTEPDHIQLGFFAGASLADPKGLLRGKGKHVRHIRIETAADIDEAAFGTMIRKAIRACG